MVDAELLLGEVRDAVYGLTCEMRNSEAFQTGLVTYVRQTFAMELNIAQPGAVSTASLNDVILPVG